MRAVPLQGLYSTAHSKHRCPEDVEFVDIFHRADANAEAESRLADLHLQNRAARRCQLLAVVQAIRHSPPVENHRSGHDRPSQRPATRLIYTGHRAIMKVFMKEISHGEEIGRAHVLNQVTYAHLVCRFLLENNKTQHSIHY